MRTSSPPDADLPLPRKRSRAKDHDNFPPQQFGRCRDGTGSRAGRGADSLGWPQQRGRCRPRCTRPRPHTALLHRFYLLFEAVYKYVSDYNKFLQDVEDGVFIQQVSPLPACLACWWSPALLLELPPDSLIA